MAGSYLPYSGVNARVSLEGLTGGVIFVNADTWVTDTSENVQDAPSFEGNGYMDYADGMKRNSLTISGTTNSQNLNLAGVKLGLVLKVRVISNKTNNTSAFADQAKVARFVTSAEADGKVSYVITFTALGSWLDFSGAAA